MTRAWKPLTILGSALWMFWLAGCSAERPATTPDASVACLSAADLDEAQVARVVKPEPKRRKPPRIPASVRRIDGRQEAVVEALIDCDGAVRNIAVVSSTHPDYADAVVDSIERWTFEPATLDGRPVRLSYRLTQTYTPGY